ncbi:MAG: GNAT family N-acetyltransferase [Patescibacteria group bacterium]
MFRENIQNEKEQMAARTKEVEADFHEQKMSQFLENHEVISYKDGDCVIDVEKIKNFSVSKTIDKQYYFDGVIHYITNADIFEFLKDKQGRAQTDEETSDKFLLSDEGSSLPRAGLDARAISVQENKNQTSPIVALPKNIYDAKNGDLDEGILKPWEVTTHPDFRHKTKLTDGAEASLADLFYLNKIKEAKIHRDQTGALVYWDGADNQFKKFVATQSDKIFQRRIVFSEQGKNYSFHDNTSMFINKFLPLVKSLNLFEAEDFRRVSGSSTAQTLLAHERKIFGSPYINISNSAKHARYYIGRDKIVGTDQKINENMRAVELDQNLVGVTEDSFGRRKLLYTFQKFNDQEYKNYGLEDKESSYCLVSGKEMKKRVNEYQISDYLPQHKDESAANYANRLANLNDVKLTSRTFRDLALKAETPINDLSWAEQLLITNYAFESKDENKLLNFVKQYKVDGLRSLITAEVDQRAGDKIMAISEKLPFAQAKTVFEKISGLNQMATRKADELVDVFFDAERGQAPLMMSVHKALLKKTSEIVTAFYEHLKKDDNIEDLLSELEKCKAEMIMLASVLKEGKLQGEKIDLETIRDLNLEIKDYGQDIAEPDKKNILKIAQANWKNFGNDKMAQVVYDGLVETLNQAQEQKAYILKYKDEVIGFVRFERTSHGTVYAGSLNVSKDLRGLSIGNELMEKALLKEGELNILEASASIKIPAGCNYIEKIGFIADGLIVDYHGTGENLLSIKLDKEKNKEYSLRNEGKDKLLSSRELQEAINDYKQLDNLMGRPYIVLRFDLNTEMAEYQAALSRLLPQVDDNLKPLEDKQGKYTLTRYFYDKNEDPKGNIRYLVFEKN